KLDGYYLLSDALGIPNLRSRAFRYLKRRLAALVASPAPTVEELTPRERRVYVAYSLLAGGYGAWLLGWVAWMVGSFLTERYQGAGAVLYAGLLGVAFQGPMRRWAARPALVQSMRWRVASISGPTRIFLALAFVVAVLLPPRSEPA